MTSRQARILILCKTYPSPSSKHAETSCVAGMEESGALVRLYPVPFRLIQDKRQFKKWQWVNARIERSKNDHRRESHKVFVDTINCDEKALATDEGWRLRRDTIKGIPVYDDFAQLELDRAQGGATLGIVRPATISSLEITAADRPDWTDEEKAKLQQLQRQGDMWEEGDARRLAILKKVPFEFHYRYSCTRGGESREYRHKIVDWEVGALYWNTRRSHHSKWQEPFRAKVEKKLPMNDLMFLMGTIHRFPDQWLIVSLLYPPKQQPTNSDQRSLFDP